MALTTQLRTRIGGLRGPGLTAEDTAELEAAVADAETAKAGAETALSGAEAAQAASELAAAQTAEDRAYVDDNLLEPDAPQPGQGPMAYFGQESADQLAADSGVGTRLITLPATAIQRATGVAPFWIAGRFRVGQQLSTGLQREVLASNGGSFETSGASSGISLAERANSTAPGGAWGFNAALQNSNSKAMFLGLAPALNTQPKAELAADYAFVMGMGADYRPQLAFHKIGADAPHYRGRADDVRAFNEFYFPAASFTDGVISRTSNVLTYTKTGLSAGTYNGKYVLITSVDQPGVNGVYLATSLVNGTLTAPSTGADFAATAANASIAIERTPADLIDTLGGYKTAIASDEYGWSGGISRIECWHGDAPPLDGEGLIDANWLARYANSQISDDDLPGTKRFAITLSAENGWEADADGAVTGTATLTGTPYEAPQTGGDWLTMDPWLEHIPFATDLDQANGSPTGTVEIGYASRAYIGVLMGSVEDEDGNTLVAEQIVSEGTTFGRGTISVTGVPNGMRRYLRIYASVNPSYSMLWGPFSVGPSVLFISQSTKNVHFSTTSTGSSLAPIAAASGVGTVGDVAGGLTSAGTNPTDAPEFCLLAKKRVAVASSAGSGIVAFTNKLVELQEAVSGIAMAAAAYNGCRSGHAMEIFWADRLGFINEIGTATAGVAKTGTWYPHPMWASTTPVYVEEGTPKLYRGGTFAQIDPTDVTSPYALTGGTLVAELNSSGVWVGSVTGTFDIDTGDYSITDPVGGDLFIYGVMQYDTQTGSTGTRLADDGFTAWGADDEDDSGHISNLLKAMPRVSAIHISWANYLLSPATGMTQAEVDAKVAFDIAMLRRRIGANYPHLSGLPWIIGCDQRTTSTSSLGEHKIRKAQRAYALATANTYWAIGAITSQMDGLSSPHAGTAAASGQLCGVTDGHAVAKVFGFDGANAEEVYIVAAERSADGTYVDLTYNVPVGLALTCTTPAAVEGIYFATTDDDSAMTLIDVDGGTYTTTIPADDTVRVTKVSGTFPTTTYWCSHFGFVLTDAVFADENARLANTLSLDDGTYDGIRPGQPISFNPVNILATQA